MADFSPYYLDGKLRLPRTTLNALIPHGIDIRTAQYIRCGVPLDDAYTLELLADAVEAYVNAAPRSPIAAALRKTDIAMAFYRVPA